MYYTVWYFTGKFYAVVRQISMLFIDSKDSVFCVSWVATNARDVFTANRFTPLLTEINAVVNWYIVAYSIVSAVWSFATYNIIFHRALKKKKISDCVVHERWLRQPHLRLGHECEQCCFDGLPTLLCRSRCRGVRSSPPWLSGPLLLGTWHSRGGCSFSCPTSRCTCTS